MRRHERQSVLALGLSVAIAAVVAHRDAPDLCGCRRRLAGNASSSARQSGAAFVVDHRRLSRPDRDLVHDLFQRREFVHFLLGPATVALAVPLYENRKVVAASILPMLVALAVGSVTGIVSV